MKTEPLAYIWVIYKWTNLINQKKYIGQTRNLNYRITCHINGYDKNSDGSFSAIHNAIVKHGIENFSFEIIHDDIFSKKEADYWELFYMRDYNSLAKNGCGYNMREGYEILPETRKKNKESNRNRAKNQNRKFSIYCGVSKSGKETYKCSISILGKHCTCPFPSEIDAAEAYDKMALYLGGNPLLNFPEKRDYYLSLDLKKFYDFYITPQKKMNKVFVYNKQGDFLKEFESFAACGKEMGLRRNHISELSSSTQKKGTSWNGFAFFREFKGLKIPAILMADDLHKKPVLLFNQKKEFVEEFSFADDAAKKYNLNADSLRRKCREKTRSATGLYWRYTEDCQQIMNEDGTISYIINE